jgi:hypothetical protein
MIGEFSWDPKRRLSRPPRIQSSLGLLTLFHQEQEKWGLLLSFLFYRREMYPRTDRAGCDQLPSGPFRLLNPGHTRGAGQPGHTRSGQILERIRID